MKNKIGWCNAILNAYIAGFFDGEGTATILTIKVGNTFRLRPKIGLAQKDSRILHLIRDYLGCGWISEWMSKSSGKGTPQLSMTSYKDIRHFISTIGKYIIIKEEQIKLLKLYLDKYSEKKNSPYDKKEISEIIDIRDKIHNLNLHDKELKYSKTKILNDTNFINIKEWMKKRSAKGKQALNEYAQSIKLPRIDIYCECGCGEKLIDRDNKARLRRYINGHNQKGKHWNWRKKNE